MSNRHHSDLKTLKARVSVFAALGDATRLSMLAKLVHGEPQSISRLTAGTNLTRQAVTKHLQVLANAGVVRSVRSGRESLFELETQPYRRGAPVSGAGIEAMGRCSGTAEGARGGVGKGRRSEVCQRLRGGWQAAIVLAPFIEPAPFLKELDPCSTPSRTTPPSPSIPSSSTG